MAKNHDAPFTVVECLEAVVEQSAVLGLREARLFLAERDHREQCRPRRHASRTERLSTR